MRWHYEDQKSSQIPSAVWLKFGWRPMRIWPGGHNPEAGWLQIPSPWKLDPICFCGFIWPVWLWHPTRNSSCKELQGNICRGLTVLLRWPWSSWIWFRPFLRIQYLPRERVGWDRTGSLLLVLAVQLFCIHKEFLTGWITSSYVIQIREYLVGAYLAPCSMGDGHQEIRILKDLTT